MNRYQTLDVSLQTDNRNLSRLSQTLDVDNSRDDDESQRGGESDERVKKFRELYYRNEKLRKELKILNMKLNQKLQKVKFPNVKKRAASVDLNYNPPNKAMIRELQNAYKQVKMYKKQVSILKVKEQSSQNYAKLRDMQNMVAYKDKQIYDVQQQIISAKNIKKSQQKQINDELENQQVKERLESYQNQHKQLRDKLKKIAKKSRKREEQYKKQQAYLVSLEKKARLINEEEKKGEQESVALPKIEKFQRQISEKQFRQVKQQIANQKQTNDEILKKIQITKKHVMHCKSQNQKKQALLKQKEVFAKTLQTKILALHRLIREQQRKERQEPSPPPPNKIITNIEEEDIEIDPDSDSDKDEQFQQGSLNKLLHQLDNVSGGEGLSKNSNNRSWKGKYRKAQHGFGGPSDQKYQYEGHVIGLNVSLDENQAICGLSFIFDKNGKQEQSNFLGNHSNVELKWVCDKFDQITKISGSFTEQSYLNQIIITSKNGRTGIFGASSSDPFMFLIQPGQQILGCFGSLRQLGKDKRITEFGFWISEKL